MGPGTTVVDVQSMESVRWHLEQSAAGMAGDGTSAAGTKTVNDYLERLQRPDLTPEDLVKATRDFLKSDFAAHIEKDFAAHGGSPDAGAIGVLNDMKSVIGAFADDRQVDATAARQDQSHHAPQGLPDVSLTLGADPMIGPQGQRYNHLDAGQIQTNLQTKTWQPL